MSLGSRDEAYWLGVRDALRMIDSFLKWSRRNPQKAKDLDDFLNEALIAAAKRCESCLSRALGVTFSKMGGEVSEIPEPPPAEGPPIDLDHTDSFLDQTPLERVLTDAEAVYRRDQPPARPEVVSAHETEIPRIEEDKLEETALPETPSVSPKMGSLELEVETPSEEDITGPSIDFLEAKVPSPEDYEAAGNKRAFDSDFDLMEPGPFDVESQPGEPQAPSEKSEVTAQKTDTVHSAEPEEKTLSYELTEAKLPEALDQLERDFSSHGLSISPTERNLEPDLPLREEPSEPDEPVIDRAESPPDELAIPVESDETGPEEVEIEQPLAETPAESESVLIPEKEAVLSPYHAPSTAEDNLEPPEPQDELPESEPEKPEVRLQEPGSRPPPPPPPPPPETDESDEERRKRARRLFFGS